MVDRVVDRVVDGVIVDGVIVDGWHFGVQIVGKEIASDLPLVTDCNTETFGLEINVADLTANQHWRGF